MQSVLRFPKTMQQTNKNYGLEDAEHQVEKLLKDHIESNFFQTDPVKKIDDSYFNENFVKQVIDKINYNYSVCSLKTMFRILEKFEKQSWFQELEPSGPIFSN